MVEGVEGFEEFEEFEEFSLTPFTSPYLLFTTW